MTVCESNIVNFSLSMAVVNCAKSHLLPTVIETQLPSSFDTKTKSFFSMPHQPCSFCPSLLVLLISSPTFSHSSFSFSPSFSEEAAGHPTRVAWHAGPLSHPSRVAGKKQSRFTIGGRRGI